LKKEKSSTKEGVQYFPLRCSNSKCQNELISTDQARDLARRVREARDIPRVKISKMSHSIGIIIPKQFAQDAGFKAGGFAIIKKAKQGINVIPKK